MTKWSISAHNCFRRCQRQYFFGHKMAHHNAKKDPKRREAHLVKQLSSLEEWRGKLVHLALEKYFVPSLQIGNIITCEELTQKTLLLAEQQIDFSQQRKYRKDGITKTKAGDSFLALGIHEPESNFDEQRVEGILEDVKQCYRNLYAFEDFIYFLTDTANWYETEFHLSFKFDEVNIVAQPDLIVGYNNLEEPKLCVIDWKVGRSQTSDYSKQLNLYGLSVIKNRKWSKYQIEDVLLVEANLLLNKFNRRFLKKSQELEIEDFLYRSISDIEAVTGDRKYNIDDLEDYDYANSPLSCKYCKFEQLCRSVA